MLLIDATGLIFRAFFSIKGDMTSPEGTPVNAVFGLTRMALKLFRDVPADACAFVFDAGRKTFRNDLFKDYKAHRPEPPEELRPQFGLSIQTAAATGAPVFVEPGYEADDIIATLVGQARTAGFQTTILTGDKDILQLLKPDVEILLPGKRGEFISNDVLSFTDKYGFPVDRFVDFKALMGDPSDNIPGVPGVGEKTAAKLVSGFGKLEQIYDNLDIIKPDGLRKKLIPERKNVFLYRDLVTLHRDVPVQYNFAARTMPNFASAEFQELLASFGFGRVRTDAEEMGDLTGGLRWSGASPFKPDRS